MNHTRSKVTEVAKFKTVSEIRAQVESTFPNDRKNPFKCFSFRKFLSQNLIRSIATDDQGKNVKTQFQLSGYGLYRPVTLMREALAVCRYALVDDCRDVLPPDGPFFAALADCCTPEETECEEAETEFPLSDVGCDRKPPPVELELPTNDPDTFCGK